jgi:hypothetical protein
MKKVLIMLLSFGLVAGISAQRHGFGGGYRGGGYSYAPRVIISGGYYSPYNPYYGYYDPFYTYPPRYMSNGRPSKLTLKVEDIKSDYADRIYSVRQDTSLRGKERRQKIRELKHERDEAIDNLKSNYYKNK